MALFINFKFLTVFITKENNSLPVCETLLFLLLLSSSKVCIQIYNPREVLSGSNLFLQSFVDNIIIHEKWISMAEVFKGVFGHASKLIKI